MVNESLTQCLERLDQVQKGMSESAIKSAITKLRPSDDVSDPPFEWFSEVIAFDFSERQPGQVSRWGTYFGPKMVINNGDGTGAESPSIQDVNQRVLDYWSKRARTTAHPVMKARYAGLVWDFREVVTDEKSQIEMAHLRIDAVIRIANEDAHPHPTHVFVLLGHALGIALELNDINRIRRIAEVLIDYEERVGEDQKPGLWGYAFDLLLKNKKVSLTDECAASILQDMEDRFGRLMSAQASETLNLWAIEAVAKRLAECYRRRGLAPDLNRVLSNLGTAFEQTIARAEPLAAQSLLQKYYDIYDRFGLNERLPAIRKRIAEFGGRVIKDMERIEIRGEITEKEMSACVEEVLTGDLRSAILRFVVRFIPRRKQVKEHLVMMASENPLLFAQGWKIVDFEGRPIAEIGSLQDDLDGQVVIQTMEAIGITSIFMREVIKEMQVRFDINAEKVMEWVTVSPLFDSSKNGIVRRGLECFFESDVICSLHLLVPQIEAGIRNLAKHLGGDVYRMNGRSRGLEYRSMGTLLEGGFVASVFNKDIEDYLRILFTDQRGFNLRNNLCHGTIPTDEFSQAHADRAFHALVLLTLLKSGGTE